MCGAEIQPPYLQPSTPPAIGHNESPLRTLGGFFVLGVTYLFGHFLFARGQPSVDAALPLGDPERGKYVLRMAGCVACHTDIEKEGEFLAGGPPIKTLFGTFYAPNITPDPRHGIGRGWSTIDFIDAITAGVSPARKYYFPAFPYTSYSRLSVQDIVYLKSYLDTVEPSSVPSKAHELN